MGIGDSGMLAVGQNVNETVLETLKHLVDDESELISVYSGEDVTEEDAAALVEKVQAAFPNCEVELNDGGQPIYYYPAFRRVSRGDARGAWRPGECITTEKAGSLWSEDPMRQLFP